MSTSANCGTPPLHAMFQGDHALASVTKASPPKRGAEPIPPTKPTKRAKTSPSEEAVGVYPFGLSWSLEEAGGVMVLDSPSLPGSSKVMGFDMDSTLIVPKSGAKFPKNADDWKWWRPQVVPMLTKLHREGFKIVIFTNQAGIEKKKTAAAAIESKILALCKAANLPMQAFASPRTDQWRKPHSSMWDYMAASRNQGVPLDLSKCFYVGDAAGRPKGWAPGKLRDFGCGDRKFGHNVGVAFRTPEELFLKQPVCTTFDWRSLDPAAYLQANQSSNDGFKGSSITRTKPGPELLLFVGKPASGKSSFAQKHLVPAGYGWVNQDTCGTKAKCKKACRAFLAAGQSCAIDNTSPSATTRAEYIDIAQALGVPVRCFVFDTPLEVAKHLNFVREVLTDGARRRVPDVGFHMYNKRFEPPTAEEGLEEVCIVHFAPSLEGEGSARLKKTFLQWSE